MAAPLGLMPITAQAQTVSAKIVGTITDPSGAVVAGAKVSAGNLETNQVRCATSATDGNYEFPFLPIGRYTLDVEAAGFQKAAVKEFQLYVGQIARVDATLSLGSVTESVSVEASALALQSESVTLGAVIDRQKVAELPLNGPTFFNWRCCRPAWFPAPRAA